MGQFDLRGYNITTEQDAIEFIDMIVAKAPQLQRVLKDHQMTKQSLISRAEFAEGKANATKQAAAVSADERSVGDRITGRAPANVPNLAQARLDQMRSAQAMNSPLQATSFDNPTVPLPSDSENKRLADAAEAAMVNADEDDDPLNLPVSPELPPVNATPVAPGTIGRIQLQVTNPNEGGIVIADPPVMETRGGPVDLAAMAAAQDDEEEIAADAGTSPSEHAANNEVQSENSKPADESQVSLDLQTQKAETATPPLEDTTPAGTRIARAQAPNSEER